MTATEIKKRHQQTVEITKHLSVSQCSGLLAVLSRPHPEGGYYLVTERVDVLVVVKREFVTRSWAVEPGKRDRFLECVREPMNPPTSIEPLRLLGGDLVAYVSDTSYQGMCRVNEDPYRAILNDDELADTALWKQPPASA